MSTRLNIVADAHIWQAGSAFSSLPGFEVKLTLLEHGQIDREALSQADILLTRSSTRVNAALLDGTPVRFAATATIGDDHYDKDWLTANGITWANAAGSSTGSVVEYMLAALLALHDRQRIAIPETTIGIIGAGRIGGSLADICRAIGMRVLINDPPRQRAEGDAGFSTLSELLEQADLLSLHTPLTHEGIDRTHHLLAAEELAAFKGRGIVNAGRGGCLDNATLLQWLDADHNRFALLDCWENEPSPMPELIAHPGMLIATPHIAGHSIDGKAANTQFAYNALCDFLGIAPRWEMYDHLPEPAVPIDIAADDDPWRSLQSAVEALYDIDADSRTMKQWAGLDEAELATAFTDYRRHYPVRRAWRFAPLHFTPADETTVKLARALGMEVV